MKLLRLASIAAVPLGALGSWAFMFHVGRHNPSALLMVLFTLWVLAPFVALGVARLLFKRWSQRAQASFDLLTLALTAVSLLIYGRVAFGAAPSKPAFAFLVVPFAALIVTGVAVVVGRPRAHGKA